MPASRQSPLAQVQALRRGIRTRGRAALAACTVLSALLISQHSALEPTTQAAALGTTYFVDCTAGNDENAGTASSQAWRTLAKASSAWLAPGDSLLLRRGCVWNGPLNVGWQGTATAQIVVGAYGTGEQPVIQSGTTNVDDVFVTGSYIVLDNVWARAVAPQRDPNCGNTAVGQISGFRFAGSAAYNTLQNSKATGLTEGVKIEQTSHHNKIVRNVFADNAMMAQLTTSPGDDYGAFGANVHGDDNEIAYNQFSGGDACSYDYLRDGSAVEIYGGQRNNVHHNQSTNNDTFTELGNSRSADNRFAYNVVTSSLTNSTFLVTRGASDGLGPVARTKAYNNTVYLTGSNATALVCAGGCSADILTLKNSIVWSDYQVAWVDQAFDEGYNLYWKADGSPIFKTGGIGPTSKRANPSFTSSSLAAPNFHLLAGSAAIGAGTLESVSAGYTVDYDGASVPTGAGVDIGAFEYAGLANPTGTATTPATATSVPTQTATALPPTATSVATQTATAVATKTAAVTATNSPTRTATVAPTKTPLPTNTPVPTVTSMPTQSAPAAATRTPLPRFRRGR
jgi:hypothetical protein